MYIYILKINYNKMINIYKSAQYIAIQFSLIILWCCSDPVVTIPEITTDELIQHIEYLASDTLQGRYPGTAGDKLAASYIRDQLTQSGLTAEAENGFQYFSLVTGISAGENNHFSVNGYVAESGRDFTPLPFSENAEITANVVFCGYGFSIDAEDLQWDDYSGVDVSGKWVMVLRGDPEPEDANSIFATYSNDRWKAYRAAEKGAAGMIMVSGERFDKDDELVEIRTHQGKVTIPVIQVTRHLANFILSNKGRAIEALEEILAVNMQPESFNTNTSVMASTDLIVNESTTMNVIASLTGNDQLLKDQYIIIGAHYDHLGTGGAGSGSRRPDIRESHPGADDNASGVAAMIEIAEKLSGKRYKLRRSYLFMAFGAEEKGLLGSRYFTENPVVDLGSVKAMINLDMVGRMNESQTLQIGGVGTSVEGESVINNLAGRYDFNIVPFREGFGPSDHASFYARDIPVFFFTTGPHPDYHTPDDRADRINYEGLQRISSFVCDLAMELDRMDDRLSFREAGPRVPSVPRHGNRRVTLGIMPDFASAGGEGLRADFVTPGRPADQGGMKQGDVIIAINGNPVKDIHEYMYRLGQLSRGETINVEVVRGEKTEILLIQL